MNSLRLDKTLANHDGSMMVIVLMIMAILSIVGINAISISSTEQKITTNVQTQKNAFYDADSGVQYTLGSLENALKNNSSNVLPASIGNTVPYNYGTPAGFFFDISDIKKLDDGLYGFTSTGNARNAFFDARSVINVTFSRGTTNAITMAAFADTKLDTKNSGFTLSYDSRSADSSENDPTDASFIGTGEADIGSNDWLVTHNGSYIDGDAVFGEQDDGTATVDDIHWGTMFTGTGGVDAGRIDPDPLGIDDGGTYDPTTYSTVNDNAAYGDINGVAISGTTITTKNGDVITLVGKSGGSNFYFTSVELKKNVTLDIDTTAGPVNIFLDGEGVPSGTIFDAKNGSSINSNGGGLDFAIYSNSEQKIDFKHNSDFTGFVYAPYADIDMKNSSNVYGALWGDNIDIKNSGTLYYDEALEDKY